MRKIFFILLFTLACRGASLAPSTTPSVPPPAATVTPLAQPSPTVASPTVAATATAVVVDEAAAIEAAVADMQQAVLARDRAAYLAHVDPADPVFALEHGRWADEWSRAPLLADYALAVDALVVDGDTATAQLTVTWRTLAADELMEARFPVRFTRAAGGSWRYAGELWVDYAADQFLVRAAPGLDATAKAVLAALPEVYAHVTASLDYVPAGRMEVKLYATAEALVANTLLSLPIIGGWNEPGESLKLYGGPGAAPEGALAHEFTHFIEFDQAGTARSRMPWWLSEGFAGYIAGDYKPDPRQSAQIGLVAGWAANGELAPWDRLSVFETTPPELWRFVYPQGYAFVAFVTEVYGVAPRNAWMKAMAADMDLSAATPTVLGKSFEALDEEFREWLIEQRQP